MLFLEKKSRPLQRTTLRDRAKGITIPGVSGGKENMGIMIKLNNEGLDYRGIERSPPVSLVIFKPNNKSHNDKQSSSSTSTQGKTSHVP